jgi:lipid-A-disaccharide synthase
MRYRGYLPYVGLPNVLAGEFIVPEFLQDRATPENLAGAVLQMLQDRELRKTVEARLEALGAELRQNASERAAQELIALLRR